MICSRRFFLFSSTCGCILAAQPKEFAKWPAGRSPAEIGKRVAEHFVSSPHARPTTIIYPETCAWYGALTFAVQSGDKDLGRGALKGRFRAASHRRKGRS